MIAHVKCHLPGKLTTTKCPGFLLGAGHTGSMCLACTNIPDSQNGNILFVWLFLAQGAILIKKWLNLCEVQGPTLQLGLFKNNSLRPAVLALLNSADHTF